MKNQRKPFFIVIFLLILGSSISFLLFYQNVTRERKIAENQFLHTINHFLFSITEEYAHLEQLLIQQKSFFLASNYISSEEWTTYNQNLYLAENYPYIQWTALVKHIPRKDSELFISQFRAQENPAFKVWPESPKEDPNSIIYIYPSLYKEWEGFNFSSSEKLQQTLQTSLTKNEVTLAKSTEISYFQLKFDNLFLILPIFNKDQSLYGWVFVLIDLSKLLEKESKNNLLSPVNVEIYLGNKTATNTPILKKTISREAPEFRREYALALGSQNLTIIFSAPYVENHSGIYSWFILLSGIILTLTVVLIIYFFFSKTKAYQTFSEKEKEDYIKNAIYNSMQQIILATDLEGKVLWCNSAVKHLLGYFPTELLEKKVADVLQDSESVKKLSQELFEPLGEPAPSEFSFPATLAQRNLPLYKEWFLFTKNKTKLPLFISVTTLQDEETKAMGYLIVAIETEKIPNKK